MEHYLGPITGSNNTQGLFLTTDWKNEFDERLKGIILRSQGKSDKFFEFGTYSLKLIADICVAKI